MFDRLSDEMMMMMAMVVIPKMKKKISIHFKFSSQISFYPLVVEKENDEKKPEMINHNLIR